MKKIYCTALFLILQAAFALTGFASAQTPERQLRTADEASPLVAGANEQSPLKVDVMAARAMAEPIMTSDKIAVRSLPTAQNDDALLRKSANTGNVAVPK